MQTEQIALREREQKIIESSAALTVSKPSVSEVLAQIGRDSRRTPEQFLDESAVPHGGE